MKQTNNSNSKPTRLEKVSKTICKWTFWILISYIIVLLWSIWFTYGFSVLISRLIFPSNFPLWISFVALGIGAFRKVDKMTVYFLLLGLFGLLFHAFTHGLL